VYRSKAKDQSFEETDTNPSFWCSTNIQPIINQMTSTVESKTVECTECYDTPSPPKFVLGENTPVCKTKAELDKALAAAFADSDPKNRRMVSGHLPIQMKHLLRAQDDKSFYHSVHGKGGRLFTVSTAPGMDTEWQKRVWLSLLKHNEQGTDFTTEERADMKRRFIVLLKVDADEKVEPQFACSDFTVIPHAVGFGDSDAAKREIAGYELPHVLTWAHVTGWTSGTMKNDLGIWLAHNVTEFKGDVKAGAALAKEINKALSDKYLATYKKDTRANVWPADFGQTLRDLTSKALNDEQFVQLVVHVAGHSVPFEFSDEKEVPSRSELGPAQIAADLTSKTITAQQAFEAAHSLGYRF
ncbi:Hypothetical protein POVN_LOCUS344, partial [uncultured virus]